MAISRAQKKFIAYFIENDFRNATNAYQRAFPNASYDTARTEAAKCLAKPSICEYMGSVIAETLQRDKIPVEKRIFDYWMRRAFYDITEIISLDGTVKLSDEELREKGLNVCIDSINKKIDSQGRQIITYKFADKDKAVEMLQKYIQMIREKIEINIHDEHLVDLRNLLDERAEQSPEERERIIAGLEKVTGNPE